MTTACSIDFLHHEPAEEYHDKAKHYLSSHALADFRRSPLLFHKKKSGLIRDEDRPKHLPPKAGIAPGPHYWLNARPRCIFRTGPVKP
ncbi:MAG: hypothetical protein QGG71_24975 [Pirellulaceae bacterium]|nr:hypothetical protein [Pirellulaceae bacterium]